MQQDKQMISEFAIASLVVGILSFISLAGMEKAIVAIIFGALALKKMERSNQSAGKNLATAGIILSIFSIVLSLSLIVKFWPKIQQQIEQIQKESVPEINHTPKTKLY
jgi:hypothetical protein